MTDVKRYTVEEIAAYNKANPIPHARVFAVQLRAAELEKSIPAHFSQAEHDAAMARATAKDKLGSRWQVVHTDNGDFMTMNEAIRTAEGFGISVQDFITGGNTE